MLVLGHSTIAKAALLASDNASNSAYSDGWTSGDNGGSGFAAWSLASTGAGATFSTTNVMWLVQAASNGSGTATRSFSGGAISLGQTFEIDWNSGTLTSGASAGIKLENSSGDVLWQLTYSGGSLVYQITDGGGSGIKSASVTSLGVHIELTLSSASAYSVTVSPINGGTANTHSGTLVSATGGTSITQFQLFFTDATATTANGQSFNNIAVVPEPSVITLAALATTTFLFSLKRNS